MIELDKNIEDLKILITEDEILKRTKELALQVQKEFPRTEELYVICVLKGSVMFFSELVKHLNLNVKLEFIRISSYGNDTKSSRNMQTIDLTLPNLKDKNVLIVEDIIDTGYTAQFLTDMFKFKHQPKKLLFISLLNKKCARQTNIEPDFYGFEIDDKFVVGFGLDYRGYFRNMPNIAYFPS